MKRLKDKQGICSYQLKWPLMIYALEDQWTNSTKICWKIKTQKGKGTELGEKNNLKTHTTRHEWESNKQINNRSQFFDEPKKGRKKKRTRYSERKEEEKENGLREECRAPSQYTDTVSSQQKEQRTHRKQTPMPEIRQQLPPSQIRNRHSKKWNFERQNKMLAAYKEIKG